MLVHSAQISSEPLTKSVIEFRTQEPIPTIVKVESMNHKAMQRVLSYGEVFISIEGINEVKCTCIAKELTDPHCPEHGD